MDNRVFGERLKKEREKKIGHKLISLKKYMLVVSQFRNGKLEKTIPSLK